MIDSFLSASPWAPLIGFLLAVSGALGLLAVLAGLLGRTAGGLWVMALSLLVITILVSCVVFLS